MKATERKRTIRFALEKNQVHQIVEDHDYNQDDLWWSSIDYIRMKELTKLESKEWRKHGYGILLKDTYETPRNDALKCLVAFCRLPDELVRRGLERHLSRQHGEERSDHKDRCRQAVLMHQQRLRSQGLSKNEILDHVSNIYRDMTMQAKVFARKLGRADQIAAHAEGDVTEADRLRESLETQLRVNTPIDRRWSNFSGKTNTSANSFDSRRKVAGALHQTPSRRTRYSNSSTVPREEYYAAIA